MIGFGTEKIEDELSLMFPDKVIKRLDLDTTRSKNAYSQIIGDFASGKIDVLIGTQMITKGLDFDNVHLVGILDADMLLSRPDFRCYERGYQLMSQVSGRAGRMKKRGKVIIQTGQPDHWIIRKVMDHDYHAFYENEITERRNFFYPPFFKIIQLTLKHKDNNQLDRSAAELAGALKQVFHERILGPEYALVPRINNFFIKQITIKVEREVSQKQVKEKVQELIDAFYIAPANKSVRIAIDVDPN
jgi:primosomal protein N' (replication factor Y)